MNFSVSRNLLLLSVGTYVVCLQMTAFCLSGGCFSSWFVLVYGWVTMGTHSSHLIWLANPILLVAWLAIATSLRYRATGDRVPALVLSGLALVVAACFRLPLGVRPPSDAGVPVGVSHRAAGYWPWLASMVAAFAAAERLPVQAPSARDNS
jgi:hypothetical protein